MVTKSVVGKALRPFVVVVVLAVLPLALAGCGGAKKSGGPQPVTTLAQARITFTPKPDLNNCGKSVPLPLNIKIVQVADPAVMNGMTQERLWGREKVLLNPLTEPDTLTLVPGRPRLIRVWLIRGTKGVVILGGFCLTDAKCPSWYHVANWSGYDNLIVKLDVGATCFTVPNTAKR